MIDEREACWQLKTEGCRQWQYRQWYDEEQI